MSKNKRGRPRKNLPLRDKGTPELMVKRLRLVQGGDPTLSTTPIDICYARKIISAELKSIFPKMTFCPFSLIEERLILMGPSVITNLGSVIND